jgi:hypothetical protein
MRLQIIVLLFLTFNISYGQNEPFIALECSSVDVNKVQMEGVVLSIYESDTILKVLVSDSLGTFENIELNYNSIFMLKFSKAKYVSKSILVDTRVRFLLDEIDDIKVFPMDVTMIKSKWWKNKRVISSSPVAAIKKDKQTGSLDYDREYITSRANEISKHYKPNKK